MIKLIKIDFAFENKDNVFSFMDKLDELRTEYSFIYSIDDGQKNTGEKAVTGQRGLRQTKVTNEFSLVNDSSDTHSQIKKEILKGYSIDGMDECSNCKHNRGEHNKDGCFVWGCNCKQFVLEKENKKCHVK